VPGVPSGLSLTPSQETSETEPLTPKYIQQALQIQQTCSSILYAEMESLSRDGTYLHTLFETADNFWELWATGTGHKTEIWSSVGTPEVFLCWRSDNTPYPYLENILLESAPGIDCPRGISWFSLAPQGNSGI
jgi:hypothetical protein